MEFYLFERLKLDYNNGNELIIKKTIKGQLITLALVLVFSLFTLFIFSHFFEKTGVFETLIIVLISGSMLFGAYKPIKALIKKEQFIFDSTSKLFYLKNIPKASFNEIECVEIVICSGGESGNSYLLNIRLHDKSSVQIDESPNKNEIFRIAGEIASFTDKKVEKK